MVLVKAKVLYNNEYVDNLYSVTWDQPSLSFDTIPTFDVETDNFHGRNYTAFEIGKDVTIYRNGEKVFYGVVEPRTFEKGGGGNTLKIKGKHKGYNALKNAMCEIYRSPENGTVINPWQWGRKNATGGEIDGINPSDIIKNLAGTLFTYQEFIDNRQAFVDKDASGNLGFLGVVIADVGFSGNTKMMAPQTGNSYIWGSGTTPGFAHSVSLHNGPIQTVSGNKIRGMGDITGATVKIFGDYLNPVIAPIIKVCRNANEIIPNRTYYQVTLNTPSTGNNVVWSGSVTFTGSESVKNQFGYVIYPNGISAASTGVQSTTNQIDYIRVDATTVSDVGLTNGVIDTYVNPSGFSFDGVSGDNVAVNLAGMNRLEGMEKIRKITVTPDDITDSPHWDGWIDNDLKVNFKKERGSVIKSEYSFAKYNVTEINHVFDSNNLVNNIIAKGAGTPPLQLTIVSDSLVDVNSINKYGNRQGVFSDGSIKDAFTLFTRAKAYFKLNKDPMETISMKIINEWEKPWNVGDRVKVRDSDLGVDGNWRIVGAKHRIRGDGIESIDVELGKKSYKASEMLRGIGNSLRDQEIFYQGTQTTAPTSSLSIPFDRDRPAVYNFIVPENIDIDRVYLYAKTDVFKTSSKAGVTAGGSGTFGSTSISTIGGGGGTTTGAATGVTITNADTYYNVATFSGLGSTLNVLFTCYLRPKTNTPTAYGFRVTDGTNNYDTPYINFIMVDQAGDYAHTDTPSFNINYPDNASGKTLTLQIKGGAPSDSVRVDYSVFSATAPTHSHNTTLGTHTHEIQYGIYEFSGDNGGAGTPMYPTKLQMFVDKLPTDAGAIAYDAWGFVGKTGSSISVDKLDITEALKDANGKIRAGSHFISFKPQGGETNNVQNLGAIAVNHLLSFNIKGPS